MSELTDLIGATFENGDGDTMRVRDVDPSDHWVYFVNEDEVVGDLENEDFHLERLQNLLQSGEWDVIDGQGL